MKMSQLVGPMTGLALALALALVPGVPPTARADDAAPEKEATTIQWVDGWANGMAASKKSGKLMFVYIGRHSPN